MGPLAVTDSNLSAGRGIFQHKFHLPQRALARIVGQKINHFILISDGGKDRDTGGPGGPWPPQNISAVATVNLYSLLF